MRSKSSARGKNEHSSVVKDRLSSTKDSSRVATATERSPKAGPSKESSSSTTGHPGHPRDKQPKDYNRSGRPKSAITKTEEPMEMHETPSSGVSPRGRREQTTGQN